ncbi:hypothetical protein [Hoeflea sp. TYP-13]|uniref:hypothetical protein n=1 Tax=Hoeflea sp. TYP-13 TaxID=3230023 RepID=UPI0034C6072C
MANDTIAKTGLAGSILALVTAVCCVLPLALMLIGLGGAWLGVFGIIAAAGYYIAGAAALIIAAAWLIAIRRHATAATYRLLFLGSALTLVAWGVLLNEAMINNYLIELM